MTYDITIKLEREKVRDRIADAFQSYTYGCGYWCADIGSGEEPDRVCYEHLDEDVSDDDHEPDPRRVHVLDDTAIARGLLLCATKHPKVFAALCGDGCDWDAPRADVLLQLCLLGEVRYG